LTHQVLSSGFALFTLSHVMDLVERADFAGGSEHLVNPCPVVT
jgi:hypothetical protein